MSYFRIMTPSTEKLDIFDKDHTPFLKRLKIFYAEMDAAYTKAATHYGFACNGCEDNCCLTRFFHHTHIECLYILVGFNKLAQEIQIKLKDNAEDVCKKTSAADKKTAPVKLMCPLNVDNMCILYDYRPMICRMHGISHELRKPGQNTVYGSGCEIFLTQAKGKSYFQFDRTPLYFEMARLEKELKQTLGIEKKFKKTIAQMIVEA